MHLVLLETAWGPHQLPDWFRINSANHSGRRLISILGEKTPFLVGNSAPETVANAWTHGVPNPAHVKRIFAAALLNPRLSDPLLVVIGGKVARLTFEAAGVDLPDTARIAFIPHPAARVWSHHLIQVAALGLQGETWNRGLLSVKQQRWITSNTLEL